MSIIQVKNLYAGYGKIKVLYDVNMGIDKGRITVLVGPNGAGKTTLLNSIMGIATIHSGKILFDGSDITAMATHKIAKMGIGYVPQTGNVFSELTVDENLRMASYLLEKGEVEDKIDEIMGLFPVLGKFRFRKAGTLSGGERRMLAIAMALMKKPSILMLDEITTDLAPILVKKVIDRVIHLRDELKISILLVEQAVKKALEVGDKAYLLVSGTIRFEGGGRELLEHPKLSKLYLGIV